MSTPIRLGAMLRRSDRDLDVHPSTRLPGALEIEAIDQLLPAGDVVDPKDEVVAHEVACSRQLLRIGVHAGDAALRANTLGKRAKYAHGTAAQVNTVPPGLNADLVEQQFSFRFPHARLKPESL